jgi:hypothetical protein
MDQILQGLPFAFVYLSSMLPNVSFPTSSSASGSYPGFYTTWFSAAAAKVSQFHQFL